MLVRWHRPALAVFALSVIIAGQWSCDWPNSRGACTRDGDCPDRSVCYHDGECVPSDVARRRGADVGDECTVLGGREIGCEADEICRMGFCGGPGDGDGGLGDGDAGGGDGGLGGCTDGTAGNLAPLFGGISQAIADGTDAAILRWFAAADETLPAELEYLVYMSTDAGGYDLDAPFATVQGETEYRISGLTEGTTYYFLVRAKDEAGQIECNENEKSVTPAPISGCIDWVANIEPIFTPNCGCHTGADPPQGLLLDSFDGVIAGGATGLEVLRCQPTESLLYQKVSMDNPPVGDRMPRGGPYLPASQIETIRLWIEQGARESCDDADICSDDVPPSFDGITTATTTGPTTAELCWAAGSDDVTDAADLFYDAYVRLPPGSHDFGASPRAISIAGATCVTIDALSPNTQQCFVVRARDTAGNRDSNTVEICRTQPVLPGGCVEYDTFIQPLLDLHCTRCHSGTSPPQWLRLDSYDNVLNGSVRRDEVIPCDIVNSLVLDKISSSPSLGDRMPRDGPPYLTSAQIAMVSQWIEFGAQRACSEASSCSDATAPTFAGATSAVATDATTIRVCWTEATDDVTPTASIRYDIYEASTSGAQVLVPPAQSTVMGVDCADIRVGTSTNMCFVVRARNLAELQDTNVVEVCATTMAAACPGDYNDIVQPILSARCTHCHDRNRPPRFLDLSNYAGSLAGGSLRDNVEGCDWSASLINAKTAADVCGQRMPFDGAPWLTPSERSLLKTWIASGARRRCADPDPCGDTTPPVFGGATSATAVDATHIEVCWNPATDFIADNSIVYLVYEGASSGGQVFSRPASYAVTAPDTCTTIPVPSALSSCYVVRARDLAGNVDTNSVEVCDTPAGACFPYDDLIQPVFDARCIQCHSGSGAPDGIRWDSYANAIANSEVEACRADNSKLNKMVDDCEMPRDTTSEMCSTTACLTPSQRRLLWQWVEGGAEVDCPWDGC